MTTSEKIQTDEDLRSQAIARFIRELIAERRLDQNNANRVLELLAGGLEPEIICNDELELVWLKARASEQSAPRLPIFPMLRNAGDFSHAYDKNGVPVYGAYKGQILEGLATHYAPEPDMMTAMFPDWAGTLDPADPRIISATDIELMVTEFQENGPDGWLKTWLHAIQVQIENGYAPTSCQYDDLEPIHSLVLQLSASDSSVLN